MLRRNFFFPSRCMSIGDLVQPKNKRKKNHLDVIVFLTDIQGHSID